MDPSVVALPNRATDVASAVSSRDHVAWLGDVLEAIAVDSLGLERPRRLRPHDARRIRLLVGDPVTAAVQAAIDRLSADLLGVAVGTPSDLARGVDDERRRAELGLD